MTGSKGGLRRLRSCSQSQRWVSSRSAPRRRRHRSSRSVSRRPTACPGAAFSYTVAPSGGSAFSVGPIKGGRCSGPITVAGATATITEAQSNPATDVKSVDGAAVGSQDVRGSREPQRHGADRCVDRVGDAGHVHQPAGRRQLRHAQGLQADRDAGLPGPAVLVLGQRRPARVDRGERRLRRSGQLHRAASWAPSRSARSSTSTSRSRPAPRCSGSTPTRATTSSTSTPPPATRLITIGAGVTVVYYDDEPLRRRAPAGSRSARTPSRTGRTADVHGHVHTSPSPTPLGATYSASVLAGQCSEPIQVAAGIARSSRRPRPGTDLTDVVAFPEDRLLTVNLINRTATSRCRSPTSPNDETQVHFATRPSAAS